MSILAKPLERFATNSLEAHWMPFTANRDFKAAPRLVTRSEGMYLWNQNGDRLIDGCSGLFNVAAGHGRREIAEAVYAQMLQNDYTAPFQLGQPTSFALAEMIWIAVIQSDQPFGTMSRRLTPFPALSST